MARLKLCFITNHQAHVDHHFLSFLSELKHYIDLCLVLPKDYNGQLCHLNISFMRCDFKSKCDITATWQLRNYFKQQAVNSVLCLTASRPLANALSASMLLNPRPKVIGFRGVCTPIKFYQIENWLGYFHPCLSHIFCVCEPAKQVLIDSNINPNKLSVLHNAFQTDLIPPADPVDWSDYNIPNNAFVIGTVANFRKVKGLDIFLKTAQYLKSYSKLHWVIIGSEAKSLGRLIKDKGLRSRIHFLGYDAMPFGKMKSFSIFCMTSRSEGISRALCEAMCLGVAPVVSRVGGNPEVIQDGYNGLMFDSENVSACAEQILKCYFDKDLRHYLAVNAQRTINQRFTVQNMVHQALLVLAPQIKLPAMPPKTCIPSHP